MAISHLSLLLTLGASLANALAVPQSVYRARQIRDVSQLLPAYDYVIVGGGTSGLTVADRLTENPGTTVLVLEAGSFPVPDDVLPVTGGGTQRQENYAYLSAPQKNLGNQSFYVILGKMVGGSSGINGMMTARGSAEDYDRWGSLFGDSNNHGWSWEGLLPYFKKALTFWPPPADLAEQFDIKYDTSYWGVKSAVNTSWPSYQYPGPLIHAFGELPGVEFTADSGAGRAGVYWFPTFMDPIKHERSYATNGHYENLNRTNYHLAADTPVRRVLLEDGRATGVEFADSNSTELVVVAAKREVIIAAGAIHTPKVLQLSGIGPRKVLEAAGIETLVDLPGVGQNFQDHSVVEVEVSLDGLKQIHPNANDLTTDAAFRKFAEDTWAANRTGPYSIAYGNIAGWLPLSAITPDRYASLADELELQDHAAILPADTHPTVLAGYAAQMRGLASAMRSKDTVFSRFLINATTGVDAPVLNQPFSRGSVNIDAADPFAGEPVTDFGALSNPVERAIMVEMIKFVRRYVGETSLAALQPNETAPGLDVVTDAELDAWLPGGVTPSDWHAGGTAAMMPLELGGVVDQALKVYGVKGLRVVDASIMPTLPGANLCQPVYAIAEKAADLIKSNGYLTT